MSDGIHGGRGCRVNAVRFARNIAQNWRARRDFELPDPQICSLQVAIHERDYLKGTLYFKGLVLSFSSSRPFPLDQTPASTVAVTADDDSAGLSVPRKFAKLLSLVRKRGLAVATADRSGRMSDDGIEHLFGNTAAEARSLECMPPGVVR